MAACQNLAVLAILTFIFYCAAATELNELNHVSVMGSVKEGLSQEWMLQKQSGDQQTYRQRGQADYQENEDNTDNAEDEEDNEDKDKEDNESNDRNNQEEEEEEKEEEQKEEHSAASTPPESTIGIINTVFNDAVEMLTKKNGRDPMCSYMTTRIKKFRHKGEISEDPEKYIELTVHKGKFVPLMSFLPMKLTSPQLAFISFNCETNEIKIETQPGLNLRVIPTIMELKNVQFSLSAVLTRITKTLEIDMKGSWFMGPLSFQANVSHSRSSGSTEISILSKSVSIDKIVKQLTGLTLPGAPQKLPSFKFSGYIESGGSATLILSSDQSKNNKFYAFYQQDKGEGAPVKAIAADISNLKLSSILKSAMRVDISRVPVFGRLAVKNIALTISSGEITDLPEDTFAKTKLLKRNGVTVASGLKAYIVLPFMSNPMTATYSHQILTLRTNSKELGLKSLLNFLGSKFHLGKMRLPKQLDAIFSLYVKEMKIFKDRLSITIVFPKTISFFNKLLSFSKIIVTIFISNKTPKLSVKATGNVQLAGANFQTAIFQDRYMKYTLRATGKYLDIHKVFVKLSAAVLPDIISSLLKNIPFLHFGIQKPSIVYKFNSRPMNLVLGGTPVIHGFKTLHFDAIITKVGRKNAVIMGFELYKINIADILKKVTGFDFHSFAMLNQELAITITIAPSDNNDVHFISDGLKGVPITKGVSVTASMQFPKKCDQNKVCRLSSKLIGKDASFSIQATIQSITYFPITASIKNLRLGKKLVLSKASLKVVGGANPGVGFVGSISIKKFNIVLSASVSISSKGFSLGMSMRNCWVNVFKQKWLSICNIIGSISFAPPTGVSGFEIGGEIRVGYASTGHQITAKGYLGVNIISPNENYYYVSFTELTVGYVLKAFKINVRIPRPLAISGFPKGFLSSFSPLGKELPQVGLSIPAGFRFKGTLNILGLESMVDVNINLPNGIKFMAGLPPISIAGGLFKMYASSKDKSKGPYLNATVQILPRPFIDIEAKGFVSFIGITLETSLKITNREYKYFIKGNAWGLFQASFLIHAQYGSIKTAGFRVKGEFKSDLFEKIQKTVVDALNNSAKKATAAINKAKAKLERAKVPFDRAINKLRNARQKLDRAKDKLRRAGDKVARTRHRLMNKCPIRHCKKFWGIPNPICLIRNAACWVFRKAVQVTLTIAEKIVRGSVIFLNVAKAALYVAEGIVRGARATLDVAKGILSAVNWTYRFAIKAATWIIKFALTGLINIHRIYFDMSLGLTRGGHFEAGIDVTFFRKWRVNARISINIKCILCIAIEIAKRMGKGISKLLG